MILTKEKIESIDLDSKIDELINNNNSEKLLLIYPTNRKIRERKAHFAKQFPNVANISSNLHTIRTLTESIALFTKSEGRIAREAEQGVLLESSIVGKKLDYFAKYTDSVPKGTLDKLRNIFREFKENGLLPEGLNRNITDLSGSARAKADDIAYVYETYNSKLNKLNIKEYGDIYSDLQKMERSVFEQRFTAVFPKVEFLVFTGYSEFTTPEIEIIDRLSKISRIKIYILFDYFEKNRNLFLKLEESLTKFKLKGFVEIKDISRSANFDFHFYLKENLFRDYKSKVELFPKIEIVKCKCQTLRSEVEFIASEIKNLLKNNVQKTVQPHEIGVVINLIQEYSPLIRDVFNLYGIPLNLTDRHGLNSYSSIIAIMSLLEIAENQFYYKDVVRALSGRFFSETTLTPFEITSAAKELRVISGYKNWVDNIEVKLAELKRQEESEKNERQIRLFTNLKLEIENLKSALDVFKDEMSPAYFFSRLKEIIYKFDLPKKILLHSGKNREENIKALNLFFENIEDLLKIYSVEHEEKNKIPLSRFLAKMRTSIKSSRFNTSELPNHGVLVTTPDEIRGLNFNYLFFAGLVDDNLPTRFTPEIFFLENYSRNQEKHNSEERYLFYKAINSINENSKRLTFSFPVKNNSGDLTESSFLSEFSTLFSKSLKIIHYESPLNLIERKNIDEINIYSTDNFAALCGKIPIEFLKIKTFLSEESCPNSENTQIGELVKNGNQEFRKSLFACTNLEKLDVILKAREIQQSRNIILKGNTHEIIDINTEFSENYSEFKGVVRGVNSNIANEVHSITKFQCYAKCPYQYFSQYILNLQGYSEPSEEIEAFDIGLILHEILCKFISIIRDEQIILQNCDNKTKNYAEKLIIRIAKEVMDEKKLDEKINFYIFEKIMGIGGSFNDSILSLFLQQEYIVEGNFRPEYLEHSFGKSGDFEVEGIKLKGTIDRVDIDECQKYYRVFDYKTGGNKPTEKELSTGQHLQLPLYMIAIDKLLEYNGDEYTAYFPAIYSLKFSDDVRLKKVKFSRMRKETPEIILKETNQLKIQCRENIKRISEGIKGGNFIINPDLLKSDLICQYCNFKYLCRVTEIN